VYRDDSAQVQRLIRAGANVSLANDYGATAMSVAAAAGICRTRGLRRTAVVPRSDLNQ
jgi:hypothetical protein